MEAQFNDIATDSDALIEQHLGRTYAGRRFLRYAELEALGLVDNRGTLENWMAAGAFPLALRIPGKYGKVLVWSAVEVAALIARRFRERDGSAISSTDEGKDQEIDPERGGAPGLFAQRFQRFEGPVR
jgi:hypothetical protein